ncbi:MAG: D-inositol-3-phosphate glycosyltransferase [Methanocella sp. PtaU1.Bin125]|nr:MAG: D-inositol-3-phosphate glycosyltransferase [Methanocella sp. PtaU1.Bin125]
MSKSRICVVGPSKKFLSGISYYNIRLANSLTGRYNVSALCFRNLLPRRMFPGHKHVGKDLADVDFDPAVRAFDGMDYNNPLTWYRAFRFLRQEKPDVIVLQWWTSSVAHMHLLISLMSAFLKARMLIEFHEVVDPLEESILPIRLYSRVMGRWLIRRSDGYVTHSESDRKLLAEKYGMDAGRIHVLPMGLYDHHKQMDRTEARQALGIEGEDIILSFGLIRPYKGIPYLIKAFSSLPADEAQKSRLLLVGEIWEDRASVEDAIAASPYRDRITLVDRYVSDAEVAKYFSAADIVVLPYLRASQSAVAHVAMAFGKPIVVSRVGGLQESMADYEGTCFVPPADPEAIRDAIVRIRSERPGPFQPPKRGWDEIAAGYAAIISGNSPGAADGEHKRYM